MDILIVGGGGLGTVYAGYLARADARVTLFVKPMQAAAFDADTVHINGLEDFSAPVRVASSAHALGSFDYMLVCVKGRDTESALAPLRDVAVESALSFQNGVKKDDVLVGLFGRDRVLGATSAVGGTLLRPGHARHTLALATQVGELDGRPSERGERLAATLRESGLPATCVSDIVTREWDKLTGFLRTAPVAALARLDIASVLLDPDLASLCARIVREVGAAAAAEGHPLTGTPDSLAGDTTRPEAELVADFARIGRALREQGPPTLPSMAQDVIAGRPTELEDTAGDVLLRAERHGLPAPTLAFATGLLRFVERSH